MHMKNSFYSYSKPVSYSDLQAPTMTTTTIPAPEPTTTSVPKPLPTTTLRPVTPMRFSLVIGVQVGKPEGISFYPSKTAIIPSPSLNYMPIRLVRNGRTVAQATTNTRGLAALSGVMAGDTLLISNARTGVLFRDFWKFDIPAPAWGAMVTLAPIIQKPIIKPILR